ncbi:MAG: hypothetical protein ACKOB8_03695 [Mycobacterium sp.]
MEMLQHQLDEVRLLLARARELFGDSASGDTGEPPLLPSTTGPQRVLP